MIKNRKILLYLSLIFSLVLCVTPTLGKYTASSFGVAWKTNFSNFAIVGDLFAITKPEGEESGKIWGAPVNEQGIPDAATRDEFSLGELNELEMSVYNGTNVRMIVTFEIELFFQNINNVTLFKMFLVNTTLHPDYVMPDLADNNEAWNTKIEGETLEADIITSGTAGEGQVLLNRNPNLSYVATLIRYYQHIGTVDPRSPGLVDDISTLEEEYVLDPGEAFDYHLRVRFIEWLFGNLYDSFNSAYSSIKITATPYNG